MCNINGVRDCKELLKLVSKMCETTFSMMKQSNLKSEIEWEAKHCTIVSEKPQRKKPLAPNTPDPLSAKGTRHLIRFAGNGSIQRSSHA